MSTPLQLNVCPETGICSVVRSSTEKLDLMPDEVTTIRDSADDLAQVRAVLAESDSAFTATLSEAEVAHIAKRLA